MQSVTFRDRLEDRLGDCAAFVLRHRVVVIGASLLATAVLALGVWALEIETSFEGYLPETNARQQEYREFRALFGAGERIVILLEPSDVFDPAFLVELRRLHELLEERLPFVDRVTSLVNARELTGAEDVLEARGLLDDWPSKPADLARVRATALANPLYLNTILDRDARATSIVIGLEGAQAASGAGRDDAAALGGFDEAEPRGDDALRGDLLSTAQTDELVRALEAVLAEATPSGTDVHVAGTPLLSHRLGVMLTRDVVTFFTVSFVLSGVILFLLFRTLWGTLLPLLVVGLSVVGTLGFMGLVGIPLTAVTEILPSLLVAIGVGDAVHIQAMFSKRREEGDSSRDAIRWSMAHSGLAVILTSLTTGASMAAFRSASLQPIMDLGAVAPFGVGLALLYSLTLLPALLSFVPDPSDVPDRRRTKVASRLDAVLAAMGRTGTGHPRAVLAVCALVAGVAAIGASSLRFSQEDLKWLPEDDSIRLAVERLNVVMEGAEPFELMIETTGPADFREPELLAALDALQRELDRLEIDGVSVAQSISLVDVLKETHAALTDGDIERTELPETRELASQELLLFESAAPDDLAELSDESRSIVRVMTTVPFVDALHYPRFARAVTAMADEIFARADPGGSIRITATGMVTLGGETFEMLFVSMARSYAIAFGAIIALMFMLIGHLRLGVLSIIPNLLPILLVLGWMGYAGAPIDVSSMLVGGILIGVVVDDTIHFVHNFSRYRGASGCSLDAIRQTLATTGRAMLVTSIVLGVGFFSATQAWLQNVSDFGLYCGIGVILAFLADVIVLPALVAVALPCDPDGRCDHRPRARSRKHPVHDPTSAP